MLNKDSVSFESYEKMAEYYFRYIDEKPYNADYERPGTLSLLPEVTGKKILDAGCGAGWYTNWLIEHGADVTAIDFSPNMVRMTRERVGNKARIMQADLNNPLKFNNQSFDLIISSLVLHYIKDWERVMGEFYRILKPLGYFVFSVHHPFMDFTHFDCENYFATQLLEDEWETHEGKVKVQFYRRPLSKIISPLVENGFVIEDIIEPMPTERFRIKAPVSYEKLTKYPQFLFFKVRKEIR